MKKSVLYILWICLILACQKEKGITPATGFENLYTITDNPGDSIQHKRYELYQKYGVPVYFNDTIGQVFVKVDVNGDSVFRYETLDLNWAFSGTNSGSVTYQVTRLTDPELKMKALRFAETFLENCQTALYPYALWLTEKCYQLSSAGVVEQELICRYRNLMFSQIESMKEEEMVKKVQTFRNEVVKLKVQNYDSELSAFNKLTDEKYYNVIWSSLYPEGKCPYYMDRAVAWKPEPLQEEWDSVGFAKISLNFRKTVTQYGNKVESEDFPLGIWTEEDIDKYTELCRERVGACGFVCYEFDVSANKSTIAYTPKNTEQDLELFLVEMMKYPRKEFLKRWEHSPLVIKKYEILYAIIRDEFGVEL